MTAFEAGHVRGVPEGENGEPEQQGLSADWQAEDVEHEERSGAVPRRQPTSQPDPPPAVEVRQLALQPPDFADPVVVRVHASSSGGTANGSRVNSSAIGTIEAEHRHD